MHPNRTDHPMPHTSKSITTDLVESVKQIAAELTADAPSHHKFCRYADLRIEATEEKQAGAENGDPKYSAEDGLLSIGIRVLAGDDAIAPGYFGQTLGRADLPDMA